MSGYDYTMYNLRQLVITQYHCAPVEAQQAGHRFFDAMDGNTDGTVDYSEFRDFLISEGFEKYSNKDLFKRLDMDGNRGLDFWEVMSFYYIIKSERPFCCGCDDFLWDAFCVCSSCYGGPYYFCSNCYQHHNNEVGGEHNYPSYTQQMSGSSMQRYETSNEVVTYSPSVNPSWCSSSLSIVPVTSTTLRGENSPVKIAYKAFEMAVSVANLFVGIAGCVTM